VSGETESNESGWTVDTLHSHVQELFKLLREQLDRQWTEERRATDIALRAHDEALKVARETSEKAIDAALSAQKEAVLVQAKALEQYDSKQNEWRGSLNDLGKMAMPRTEGEAAIQRSTERIQEAMSRIQDVVLAQQHFVTRTEMEIARTRDAERISDLTTRVTRAEALAAGGAEKMRGIYAALAGAVALISILVFLANALFSDK
jgi:hypothetical protein